jgi:hypothetical protein
MQYFFIFLLPHRLCLYIFPYFPYYFLPSVGPESSWMRIWFPVWNQIRNSVESCRSGNTKFHFLGYLLFTVCNVIHFLGKPESQSALRLQAGSGSAIESCGSEKLFRFPSFITNINTNIPVRHVSWPGCLPVRKRWYILLQGTSNCSWYSCKIYEILLILCTTTICIFFLNKENPQCVENGQFKCKETSCGSWLV